ncbi:ABC transporter permease [Tabrizicola sp.]|uniref:ABC transporter permease n=1 Tax=Tabrizicola sp. TaxID=2005166 RepID=UPI00286D0038|nr:ABC transporter permease [Tabrizicola sp.]
MQEMMKRYGGTLTAMILLLTAFWILILLILPNLTMFESSFRPYLPVIDVGGPKDTYSVNNYLRILGGEVPMSIFGFEATVPPRVKVFLLTIFYSMVVTVITFIMAYPLAYYLAKIVSPKSLPTLFLLLFVPLWVSEILRSFAWWIILALKGPLNVVLMSLGIIDTEIRWISGFSPVIIGLVYTYVLFMMFPLFNAMQSLDSNQIEAAEDLGSPWWRTHWRVILPHAKPGIASGAVMVFMLSAGSLLVPALLGSTTSGWFTQTIQGVMLEEQDWNTGAAFAFMLLIVCTLAVSLAMRVFRVKLSDIAK